MSTRNDSVKQRNWLERLPTEDLLIIAKELEVDSATALASCSRKLRLKLLSHLFQSVSLLYDVIRPQRAANKARFFLEHSALWSLVSRLCVVSHGAGLRINGLDLAALLCSPSLIHLDSELGRNRDRFSLKNEMAARAARLRVTRRRLRTDTSLFLIKHTPAVRHLHITGDHEELDCFPLDKTIKLTFRLLALNSLRSLIICLADGEELCFLVRFAQSASAPLLNRLTIQSDMREQPADSVKYLFGILPAFSALKIFAIDLPLDDPRAGGQEAKEGRTMLRRQLASRLPFLQELYVGRQLKRYVVH